MDLNEKEAADARKRRRPLTKSALDGTVAQLSEESLRPLAVLAARTHDPARIGTRISAPTRRGRAAQVRVVDRTRTPQRLLHLRVQAPIAGAVRRAGRVCVATRLIVAH